MTKVSKKSRGKSPKKVFRIATTEVEKGTMTRNEIKKSSVLIADDDEFFRGTLAALFQHEGFYVTCVGNVDDIFELVAREKFDVIVIDMYMPKTKMGPIETDAGLVVIPAILRKYAEINAQAILVVLTGFPNVRDCFATIDAGAYYIPKAAISINRHVVDMGNELVQECKTLIERRREKNTSRPWLEGHYSELMKMFPGQAVAVLNQDTETGKLKTTEIGEYKVVSSPSVEKLKKMILRNPLLRKAMPLILDIWKEED
jgi:ActR/RegA family two-component response regulator